jgi:hypothetical protein
MTNLEIEKGFQEIWNLFKETDRILEERFKETDRILEERFKETDQKIKETSEEVNKTSRAVNALTGKWGKFVEGLIAPSVVRLFKEREIEIDTIYQRAKKQKNGFGIEIDILAINGEYAVLIEAKSTLRIEDVNEHLERLKAFKGFFPEYQDRKVIGAVGALVIEENADKYAYKKGLFIIVERGESVIILNDEKFKPQIW